MSRTDFAALPLVLLIAACGSPKDVAPPAESSASGTEVEGSSKIPMRGIVSVSADVTTFSECGAPAGHVLTLADPKGELAKALASVGAKPANGMYVELEGAPAADGKSATWTRLVRARPLGETIACDAPVFEGEFFATGNEPFWTVEIRENGISYRSPELPKGRTYPYAFTRTETGSVVYATKTDGPKVSTLEVALEPATCLDSMSGELRSFKAHVALDGRKLEGCAVAGVPHGEFGDAPLDELNRFAGAHPHTVHLWKDPVLEKRLEALLGPMIKTFLENMKVEGPLTIDNGIFYVLGNNAIFLADPDTDTLAVIVYVNGARREFKEGGRDVAIPPEVAKALGNVETP